MRLPITAWASITHRASGVFLFAGMAVLLWALDASLSSPESFDSLKECLANPLAKLVIWAVVSFGFGILLRPLLSGIAVGGTDLGFWFAQQGSILVFLALIFFYAWRMNKLDVEHGVDEE